MVTVVATLTFDVVTPKLPLACPAGITSVDTDAVATELFDEEIATVMSPGAAAQSSATVPATLPGPTTGLGLKVSDATPIGRTVKVALFVTPP
jgi:hypothetical protein